MKREMNKTSLVNHEKNLKESGYSKARAKVLNALIELGGKATLYEVANHLKKERGQISGRFTELSKGKSCPVSIESVGFKDINGFKYNIWKVKDSIINNLIQSEA